MNVKKVVVVGTTGNLGNKIKDCTMISHNDNIETFKLLFRGRQDIYAVHWEKDGKSGYTKYS